MCQVFHLTRYAVFNFDSIRMKFVLTQSKIQVAGGTVGIRPFRRQR